MDSQDFHAQGHAARRVPQFLNIGCYGVFVFVRFDPRLIQCVPLLVELLGILGNDLEDVGGLGVGAGVVIRGRHITRQIKLKKRKLPFYIL